MSGSEKELVAVFVPALGAVLVRAEDLKGEPLTNEEVIRIRDNAPCIMMTPENAAKMEEYRGFRIDPENCWFDWQKLRRELGRKPDLDPGPRLNQVRSSDPAYQQTIKDAKASLKKFRAMLPADGSPSGNAMVKTEFNQGDHKAFLWLSNARILRSDFVAEFFEVPESLPGHRVGDEYRVQEQAVIDWMVNDAGVLHGGFSIRYIRSTLPEDERAEYDGYIGVTEYA